MTRDRGQWGQRGQCFSHADQQQTLFLADILRNQLSGARVTVKTLSPLSPLSPFPPFWVVDDRISVALPAPSNCLSGLVPGAVIARALPPTESAEEAEWRLRVKVGIAVSAQQAMGVLQTFPQDAMLAGMLAASRIRPPVMTSARASNMDTSVEDDTDPWAAGIAKLQQMGPLGGFSIPQWKRVQCGCASLFATHGAEMRRLGWSTEDAFGVHPDAPGAAVHAYGLGLLLSDGKVTNMTGTTARIETRRGVSQTFIRKPNVWSVPAWNVLESSCPVCART